MCEEHNNASNFIIRVIRIEPSFVLAPMQTTAPRQVIQNWIMLLNNFTNAKAQNCSSSSAFSIFLDI